MHLITIPMLNSMPQKIGSSGRFLSMGHGTFKNRKIFSLKLSGFVSLTIYKIKTYDKY